MPSKSDYDNLQRSVRKATVMQSIIRAKQKKDISAGLYFKNGLLNDVTDAEQRKKSLKLFSYAI